MSETACTCYRDGGAPCAWCAGLPRDRTPAPAAPPEAEAKAILRRKEVRQPCSGKRGDGPWVLVEPAIYLSVTERDTVLAALAAASARAERAEKERQESEGDLAVAAQRLIMEVTSLEAEAERLRVDGDRRVEAMREACMKAECKGCANNLAVVDGASIGYPGVPMHDYPSEEGPLRSSCKAWRIRALPAAQAEAERLRGERADLQHKLAHWQRVAEESGTMVARRVEAMREAAQTLVDGVLRCSDCCEDGIADCLRHREEYRALFERTATPAPEKPMQEGGGLLCPCPTCQGKPTTPAPGPSAEGGARLWKRCMSCGYEHECGSEVARPSAEDAPDEMEPEEYAAYIQRTARAPGGQDVR